VGTKGRIDIPRGWLFAEHFSVVTPEGKEDYAFPFEHNGYTYEAEETMRCLREGERESPIMPHEDTLLIMHTLDSIRKQWGLVYPTE
jgi:predicted dehydrogenase